MSIFNVFKRQPYWFEEVEQTRRSVETLERRVDVHDAWLRRHDEQIAVLEFKVEQAENDIRRLKEHVGGLYALLDIAEAEQAGALPGSKTDVRCQTKILSLNKRIDTAEKQLRKAQFDHTQAVRKMEDAI